MGKDLNGNELGNGIIQKKSGLYEARYNNRFGKRVSISGCDLRDVKRRYNEAIFEDTRFMNIRDKIKLNEWYSEWMNVYKIDVIRENTKLYYNQVFYKYISPVLGNFYLQDITQYHIKKLIKSLSDQGYRYETKNKVRIILFDIFNKALASEFVRKNPVIGIKVNRDEDREVHVLTMEDQIDFFNCCKGTFYDNFFTVALTTGMRIGEIAALRKEDIDFDKRVIHVRRTLVYQKYESDEKKTFHFELPKTKTSLRVIPINKQCETALKKQIIQKRVVTGKAPKKPAEEFQNLIFTTKYDTPLNPQIICDAIRKIVNEVNLMRDVTEEMESFSCHCFRHTFATRCFEAGIQPKTVQTFLGHASLQMTMDLYTSVLPDHKTTEMEKLQTALESVDEIEKIMVEKRYEKNANEKENIINLGCFKAI